MKQARSTLALLAVLLAFAFATASYADEPRIFINIGGALIAAPTQAQVEAGGMSVPGASIAIQSKFTAGVEVGYFLTSHVSASAVFGIPAHADVTGSGTAASFGRLGSITYGPATFSLQFHFGSGLLQPYVGAGVMPLIILDSTNGALANFHVDSGIGPMIRAGVNVMPSKNVGFYLDVKKGWVKVNARGLLGNVPATAEANVDPLISTAGLVIRIGKRR